MTAPEHTLVGIHSALACGLHRRWGWPAVAMAGMASNIPDWDGLPMLGDVQQFEAGHRVWGHNLIAIAVSSAIIGWTQYRRRWIERAWSVIQNKLANIPDVEFGRRETCDSAAAVTGIAAFAQLLHLPCDMVVSGGQGLSDWHVQPLWPASQIGVVFPLIPWGDVGPTVILMAGAIWMACRRTNLSAIARATLLSLGLYLAARGWARGIL